MVINKDNIYSTVTWMFRVQLKFHDFGKKKTILDWMIREMLRQEPIKFTDSLVISKIYCCVFKEP